MLSAYLYVAKKNFLKKKINVVFAIVGVVMVVGMLALTGVFTKMNGTDFDPEFLSAGLSILTLLMFDLTFLNIVSGVIMYTNPDVNFFFAGPFTRKFNLIIPIVSSLKNAALMVFVVSMQSSYLSGIFHFRFIDALIAVIAVFVVCAIGNVISQVITMALHNKKTVKTALEVIFAGFHVLLAASVILSLKSQAGSFSAISSLGSAAIVKAIGNSIFLKIIPVGGWLTLIFDGIYLSSMVKLVLGIVLTIATIAITIIIINNFKFDYYEEAIAAAQKMADKMAAKAAGIENMSSVDTSKINVENGSFKGGSGASVFFYKHLLENKRFSKLFFLNKTLVAYKIVAFLYSVMMTKTIATDNGGKIGSIVGAMMMLLIFDSLIFAGGKAVLEYNKPYFFLIPEKTYKKLWACIAGNIPEVIISGIASAAIVCFVQKSFDILTAGTTFALFVVADLVCIFLANIIASLFNYIGKTPAMMLRQFIYLGLVGAAMIPGIVVAAVTKTGLPMVLGVSAVVLFVILIIVSILGSLLIERKEMV